MLVNPLPLHQSTTPLSSNKIAVMYCEIYNGISHSFIFFHKIPTINKIQKLLDFCQAQPQFKLKL